MSKPSVTASFHIYSAKTIDEGIEILTDTPAGERKQDGTYPEGSVNYLVDKKLKQMAEKLKVFYTEEKKEKAMQAGAPVKTENVKSFL